MRTKEELVEKLNLHCYERYIYNDKGYLAWKMGTGENIEIKFIEVSEKGKGYATELVREMLTHIEPYHSVYVFRLAGNESAGHFYRKCGFEETTIKGLYGGDDAVLGVASYEILCKNLLNK